MDLNWGPVGTPEHRQWFRTFEAAGVDHFICRFGSLDQFGQVERFAREVLPALRGRPPGRRVVRCRRTRLREHAELIVNTCFSVETGDVVTIICDDRHAHLARVVAQVASEKGAWPVIMNNETQVANGLADTLFPMAPPRNLHDAMLAATRSSS
jgi:hypothetical protein